MNQEEKQNFERMKQGTWKAGDGVWLLTLVERLRDELAEARGVDFKAHLKRQREWSEKTFGPGSRLHGVTDHIRKELTEVIASGGSLKEWVDVAILALDGAWRSGASPDEIVDAIVEKQTINEQRKWPDWRSFSSDTAIEHDRTAEAAKKD